MCYYELEPWGEEKADLRAGIIASTVANTARDPKKQQRPFTPADFMPRQTEQRDPEELLRVVEQWNIALGGKDLREK